MVESAHFVDACEEAFRAGRKEGFRAGQEKGSQTVIVGWAEEREGLYSTLEATTRDLGAVIKARDAALKDLRLMRWMWGASFIVLLAFELVAR